MYILAATNRPFDLDDAVLRRFTKRIYIPLPDENARLVLLKKLLVGDTSKNLKDADLKEVIKRTNYYSASDLTSLCREASLVSLREIPTSKIATVKLGS